MRKTRFNLWAAWPTAHTSDVQSLVDEWRRLGWRVALLRDRDGADIQADLIIDTEAYPGGGKAFNELCAACVGRGATHVFCGGDDLLPRAGMDAAKVEKVWRERFGNDTFGIIQPSGDEYGGMSWAAICPIIGADYIRRINGGAGPFWHEYYALYADAEMFDVAGRLGVYHTRKDMTVYHAHWTRVGHDHLPADKRAVQQGHAAIGRELYEQRKAAGFPGHEALT